MSQRPGRPINKLLYLPEHQPMFGTMQFVSKTQLNPGDVISFRYTGKEPGDVSEVRFVFVLDPDYHDKLHGLTLGMTPKNALIRDVIDPMYDTFIPYDLYYESVFKVARSWDSYRTYFLSGMSGIRRCSYFLTDKPVWKDGKRIR